MSELCCRNTAKQWSGRNYKHALSYWIRRGLAPLGMQSCWPSNKPSKPPKPQTSPQGGGFTFPLPHPTAPDCSVVRSLGVVGALLDEQNTWENMYLLLMGPFGSNQGHHLDDFGTKKRIFYDLVANNWSFGILFGERIKDFEGFWTYMHLSIDAHASIDRCGHL